MALSLIVTGALNPYTQIIRLPHTRFHPRSLDRGRKSASETEALASDDDLRRRRDALLIGNQIVLLLGANHCT